MNRCQPRAARAASGEVVLSAIGSRPVNLALCLTALALIAALCFVIVVVSSSLSLCNQEIKSIDANPWYSVLSNPLLVENEAQLLVGLQLLRLFLGLEADRIALPLLDQGKRGLVPWCAWCTANDLELVDKAMLGSNLTNETSAAAAALDLFFSDDTITELTDSCILSLVLEILAAAAQQPLVLMPSSNGTVAFSPNMLCLLGQSDEGLCDECGSLSQMGLELIEEGDEPAFLDTHTGETFLATDSVQLQYRCVRTIGQAFLAECKWNASAPENSPIVNVFSEQDNKLVSSSSRREARTTDTETSTHNLPRETTMSVKNENAALFLNAILFNNHNSSSPWAETLQTARKALVGADQSSLTIFRRMYSACSSNGMASPLELVAFSSTGGPWFANTDEESWVALENSTSSSPLQDRLNTVGLCWALYTSYFLSHERCYDHYTRSALEATLKLNVTSNMTDGSVEDFHGGQVAIEWLFSSLLAPSNPSATPIAKGYQGINFTRARELNFGDDIGLFLAYPFTLQERDEEIPGCVEALNQAPVMLTKYLDFYVQLGDCFRPAEQMRTSFLLEGTSFLICGVCVLLLVATACTASMTRFLPASLALALAGFFLSNGTVFVYNLLGLSWRDYLNIIFFGASRDGGDAYDVTVSASAYSAVCDSLGLAFLLLFHGLILIEVSDAEVVLHSAKNFRASHQHVRARLAEWLCRPELHFILAVLYFSLRCLVGFFVFSASAGWVPFVYWISVGRVCALSITTPVPRCNSQDIDSELSFFPFIGICMITIADTGALVIAGAHTRHSRTVLENEGFDVARSRRLVFWLNSILGEAFGLSILLCKFATQRDHSSMAKHRGCTEIGFRASSSMRAASMVPPLPKPIYSAIVLPR